MKMKIAVFLNLAMMILGTTLYGESKPTFMIHDPQGNTMELVDFRPRLINYQSNIKYPAKWYVREDATGVPGLFITREPIREITDRYTVGASIYYRMNYFIDQESPDSVMGKTAKVVLRVVDWEKDKQRNLEFLKNEGHKINSQSDIIVSGQPAFRIDHETQKYHAITIYIKAGIHLIVMTFEAPPQEYESYKDTFNSMIEAFSFEKEFKIISEAKFFEERAKEALPK